MTSWVHSLYLTSQALNTDSHVPTYLPANANTLPGTRNWDYR